MKATLEIDAELLENRDAFADPFFQRFSLRPADTPLALGDGVEKNYLFPTFYGDVTCALGIFLCSYERAAKLMLHPRIKPVRMTRGRSLVAFSCYEYKNVLGVKPYNEIAMTIPVMVDPTWNVPVLPMLHGNMKGFGYYVFSMPVTSEENRLRGVKIWGLPKVTEEIALVEEGGDCVTTATTLEGERYFDLRVPMSGKPTGFDVRSDLYTSKEGALLKSETNFKATFAVTKHMGQLLRKGGKPDRPYLTLGKGPAAQVLRDLQIEERPFQFRYARGMTSCFDLPDPTYRAPFSL